MINYKVNNPLGLRTKLPIISYLFEMKQLSSNSAFNPKGTNTLVSKIQNDSLLLNCQIKCPLLQCLLTFSTPPELKAPRVSAMTHPEMFGHTVGPQTFYNFVNVLPYMYIESPGGPTYVLEAAITLRHVNHPLSANQVFILVMFIRIFYVFLCYYYSIAYMLSTAHRHKSLTKKKNNLFSLVTGGSTTPGATRSLRVDTRRQMNSGCAGRT